MPLPTWTNDETLRHLLTLLCRQPWKEECWAIAADRPEELEAPWDLVQGFRDQRLTGQESRRSDQKVFAFIITPGCFAGRRMIRKLLKAFRLMVEQKCGKLD